MEPQNNITTPTSNYPARAKNERFDPNLPSRQNWVTHGLTEEKAVEAVEAGRFLKAWRQLLVMANGPQYHPDSKLYIYLGSLELGTRGDEDLDEIISYAKERKSLLLARQTELGLEQKWLP